MLGIDNGSLTFGGGFIDSDGGPALDLINNLELSAVFMLMTFVVFVGYGLFAAAIRDRVISRPRVLAWMRRSFAGAFVALVAPHLFRGFFELNFGLIACCALALAAYAIDDRSVLRGLRPR